MALWWVFTIHSEQCFELDQFLQDYRRCNYSLMLLINDEHYFDLWNIFANMVVQQCCINVRWFVSHSTSFQLTSWMLSPYILCSFSMSSPNDSVCLYNNLAWRCILVAYCTVLVQIIRCTPKAIPYSVIPSKCIHFVHCALHFVMSINCNNQLCDDQLRSWWSL